MNHTSAQLVDLTDEQQDLYWEAIDRRFTQAEARRYALTGGYTS